MDCPGSKVRPVLQKVGVFVELQISGKLFGGLLGAQKQTETFVATQAPGSPLLATVIVYRIMSSTQTTAS